MKIILPETLNKHNDDRKLNVNNMHIYVVFFVNILALITYSLLLLSLTFWYKKHSYSLTFREMLQVIIYKLLTKTTFYHQNNCYAISILMLKHIYQ